MEDGESGNWAAVLLGPKVQPQETGRTTLVENQENPLHLEHHLRHGTSEVTLPGSSCLDTLSKIFKGMMDIQGEFSAIMGKVACWDTVL